MDDMEEKLGLILNNPQLMQQIMSMAQSVGQQQTESPSATIQSIPSSVDPKLLSTLSGILGNNNVNKEEQALLNALTPYLSRQRVSKLEKAMRAARMAKFASAFLNAGGMQLLSGR